MYCFVTSDLVFFVTVHCVNSYLLNLIDYFLKGSIQHQEKLLSLGRHSYYCIYFDILLQSSIEHTIFTESTRKTLCVNYSIVYFMRYRC